MTAQTRATLKSKFEQGDTPQGSDYSDLIDSFLSLVDSSAQNITSPVTFSGALEFNAQVDFSNVSAAVLVASSAQVTRLEASSLSAATLSANAGNISTLSANAATVSALTVSQIVAVTANVSGLAVLGSLNLGIATTASAVAGDSQTLPTTVAGYVEVSIAGSPRRIPFFAVS